MKTLLALLGMVGLGVGGYALGRYHGAHPRRRLALPSFKRRRG